MSEAVLQNDLFLRAARGEKTERTPVWLMRQAGRILPEYRAVRSQMNGFIDLVTTPERAAEVTIQPVDILGVDAAIIFSDILVIPEAMGLPYEMIEKKGPHFPEVIRDERQVKNLRLADAASDLGYVSEAIKLTKKELNGRVPLIGFAGAPFTIFCYMVEGGGSKTFSHARRMLYQRPDLARELLDKITQSTLTYLQAQIQAGADLVQIFDSWAGILPHEHYLEFALPYIKTLCDAIQDVPVTVFAKGAYTVREQLNALDCQVVGLDWNMPIAESRQLIPDKVLQGNLDPCALYASDADLVKATRQMLDRFGTEKHIANLGHGVYPDIDYKKVQLFVETVKTYSAEQRKS